MGKDGKPEVWFFYPATTKRNLRQRLQAVRSECQRRGWQLLERQTARIRVQTGRRLRLVAPRDAVAVYRRMHRTRVALIVVGQALVHLNPGTKPTSDRNCAPLARCARYKAFVMAADPNDPTDRYVARLQGFLGWCDTVKCTGESDPRCLPLHVFDRELNHGECLGTLEGLRQFRGTYGPDSRRIDAHGLRWTPDRHHYAGDRDLLHVAGRTLSGGFHWDASNHGQGRGVRRVYTPREVWTVGAGGYVNIYPDAHVRHGSNARRDSPRQRA